MSFQFVFKVTEDIIPIGRDDEITIAKNIAGNPIAIDPKTMNIKLIFAGILPLL